MLSTSDAVELRQKVKRVEVKDPYTVVVQCKEPDIFYGHFLEQYESWRHGRAKGLL